ncbi:ferric-rhodotorulic acid transporter, putative [Babesia ovata]|uniref:Ferric-rhodotorulic acid transporter, putative n=1 Tax=Babesia ovata TaxID=189622 RepID=A0A2H6KIK4_9APIC|nr:ferric-rhodotorulic acid transporter, putative [Babesia ovata]GBE62816.1 ferric-rhodotorulic acid transporter, putative [Babesia ovata]
MRPVADLRECVGEGRRCYDPRVGLKRQAAEVSEGHFGVSRALLIRRLEQRWQGIMGDGEMHGIMEHGGRVLVEVRAEAFEELQEITVVCEGQAFFEVFVVFGIPNVLGDEDIHVATVAVVAQLAVLQSWRGRDLVAAALEECAEFTGCINVHIPPAAVFAALLRQPVEGVAQCGQRGEKDLGALLTFFISELCAGVGGDVRTCELGGELCEPLHQAVQSQVTQRVGEVAEQRLESVVEGIVVFEVREQLGQRVVHLVELTVVRLLGRRERRIFLPVLLVGLSSYLPQEIRLYLLIKLPERRG